MDEHDTDGERASVNNLDTNPAPPNGWRCFHCDEVFVDEKSAAAHFGTEQQHIAACAMQLTAPEKRLALALRAVADELNLLQMQVSEEITHDAYYYGRLRHDLAGIKPFAKCISLHDVFMLFDSLEGRVLAAEERANASAEPNRPAFPLAVRAHAADHAVIDGKHYPVKFGGYDRATYRHESGCLAMTSEFGRGPSCQCGAIDRAKRMFIVEADARTP